MFAQERKLLHFELISSSLRCSVLILRHSEDTGRERAASQSLWIIGRAVRRVTGSPAPRAAAPWSSSPGAETFSQRAGASCAMKSHGAPRRAARIFPSTGAQSAREFYVCNHLLVRMLRGRDVACQSAARCGAPGWRPPSRNKRPLAHIVPRRISLRNSRD